MFILSLVAGVTALLQGGALQIPAPTGLVNDFAHVLPAQTAQALTALAQEVRTRSPAEIAIVTLPDLKGRPVSEVSLDIGRQWKVGNVGQPGDPNRNAGIVILIVPKETNSSGHGECRVEVGRGAEGYITDSDAGDICRTAVSGFFRSGDYGGGTAYVAVQVAQAIAHEYHFALDSAAVPVDSTRTERRQSGGIPPIVFLFILFMLLSVLGRGRRGGCSPWMLFLPWGGGGGGFGGGGFGGGGGGGFGGFGGGGGFSGGGGGSSW